MKVPLICLTNAKEMWHTLSHLAIIQMENLTSLLLRPCKYM